MSEHIETERLILRKFKESDYQDVYEWGSDARISKLMNFDTHKSVCESRDVIRDVLIPDGSYAIILRENQECIGSIGFIYDIDHNKAELGYALKHKYWKQGYMSETISSILDYLFNTKHLNRVEAYIYTQNKASKKVLENCGFEIEGHLKQFYYHKGTYKDCYLLAITSSTYLQHKQIML